MTDSTHPVAPANLTDPTDRHIVIVETLTTGSGLSVVEAATRRARRVTFVTRDLDRYVADPLRGLLDSDAVDCRVHETLSASELATVFEVLRADAPITLIVPNELFLLSTAVAAEKAGLPFLAVPAVRLIRDKHAFRLACAAAGVSAPASTAAVTVEEAVAAAEATGYPVVLKPSIGTGSYGVVTALDADEVRARFPDVLAEAKAQGGAPLVEGFLIGPVVSAEVLYTAGTPHVLGISDRIMSELPYFLEIAARFPAALAVGTHQEIERTCGALGALLSYERGPAHIEFALTARGPVVIEFNPRFAGRNIASMVSAALGWNVFDGIIASYLGEPVRVPAPVGAAAEHALYARRGGRFVGIAGQELARRVPGVEEIRVTARSGAILPDAKDQRGEYGNLWCTGATTEEASIRAATAAAYLRPEFDDPEPHRTSRQNPPPGAD
ncbi:ATP-grasp domain-containing protein [Streptomyces youssoufiensis]